MGNKSLLNAPKKLNKANRQRLEQIIRDAVLVEELGGTPAKLSLIAEAKNLKGLMKTIVKAVAGLNKQDLDEVAHVFTLDGNALDSYVPRWQRDLQRPVIIEYVD